MLKRLPRHHPLSQLPQARVPGVDGERMCAIRPDVNLETSMLPFALKEIALAELDRMDLQKQMVLKFAAIIGPVFTTQQLVHILPISVNQWINPLLDMLVKDNILKRLKNTEEPEDVQGAPEGPATSGQAGSGVERPSVNTGSRKQQSDVLAFCAPLLWEATYELWPTRERGQWAALPKALYYVLECAAAYLHVSNSYMALMKLSEAEALRSSVKKERNAIDRFEEAIFFSLKGEVCSNVGCVKLAKEMSRQALRLLEKRFPRTRAGAFVKSLWEGLKRAPQATGRASFLPQEARRKKQAWLVQRSRCLALLEDLYSQEGTSGGQRFSRLAAP
ncbi:adenylate cyclase type 10-like [Gallus gallus]|uniref:adenylate cyclase type 10-like n=1 Tax=Gallus gallus TaxID=9031 RepID=UPI001AE19B7A|nr:adenylate cyclase type 10-like [Gallus gallus]